MKGSLKFIFPSATVNSALNSWALQIFVRTNNINTDKNFFIIMLLTGNKLREPLPSKGTLIFQNNIVRGRAMDQPYSYFNASTGFFIAALILCRLTVRMATI